MSNQLAIIIPTFKIEFLTQTLCSIANQTNKDFILYIGDDASPHDIYAIIKPFKSLINIVYHRFNKNLGGTDLVGHWERSIALSNNEEWIWLFGDDDIMSTGCVQAFYDTNQDENILYRFPRRIINQDNKELSYPISVLKDQPHESFINDFMLNKQNPTVIEYIFSRKTHQKCNGFVNLPAAWHTDVATWIKFSEDSSIHNIDNSTVSWRLSTKNISSSKELFKNEKINSDLLMLEWLKINYGHIISNRILFNWIIRRLRISNYYFSNLEIRKFSISISRVTKVNFIKSYFYIISNTQNTLEYKFIRHYKTIMRKLFHGKK